MAAASPRAVNGSIASDVSRVALLGVAHILGTGSVGGAMRSGAARDKISRARDEG